MFLRLKNVLDIDVIKDDLKLMINDNKIIERTREILQILDDSYGVDRTSRDMGGYVYLFNSSYTYDCNIGKLMMACNIDKDLYEYSDTISVSNGQRWQEELYLLSSEDSITVIHPKEIE